MRKLGIIHKTTTPYTPEHNGVAERYNRTLQEGALTLQHDSKLTNRFWVSVIHTVNFVRNRVLHSKIGMTPYQAFWDIKPRIDWLRAYGSKCWALVPKPTRKKGEYKSIEGIFVGYFDNSHAYKVWIPRTHTIMKVRDAIFDESNHIEHVTIITNEDEDDLPELWKNNHFFVQHTPSHVPISGISWTENGLPFPLSPTSITGQAAEEQEHEEKQQEKLEEKETEEEEVEEELKEGYEPIPMVTPKDFEKGPWTDPSNIQYGHGKRHQAFFRW